MAKHAVPPTATDDQVRALLKRYNCPVPFHTVRTRFMGNIATPDLQASPMEMVKALWGGTLPPFDSLEATNELIGALVMGLWNRLTRHQERTVPFRLTRIEVPATREGMARLALTRREELDGFIAGLFGDHESLDIPERAHKALGVLAEIRAMFEGSRELAENPSKPAAAADIAVSWGISASSRKSPNTRCTNWSSRARAHGARCCGRCRRPGRCCTDAPAIAAALGMPRMLCGKKPIDASISTQLSQE